MIPEPRLGEDRKLLLLHSWNLEIATFQEASLALLKDEATVERKRPRGG